MGFHVNREMADEMQRTSDWLSSHGFFKWATDRIKEKLGRKETSNETRFMSLGSFLLAGWLIENNYFLFWPRFTMEGKSLNLDCRCGEPLMRGDKPGGFVLYGRFTVTCPKCELVTTL